MYTLGMVVRFHRRDKIGELAEWSIALVLKTRGRESGPGVRIPHSPQKQIIYGCGGVGQPRWFWEPEHAVMAGVSSSLTIHTILSSNMNFSTNQTIYIKKIIWIV